MYTEISLYDLQSGLIPPFLANAWKAAQKKEPQYLTKHDHDPVADFDSEEDLMIGTGFIFSILGMIASVIFLLVETAQHIQDNSWSWYQGEIVAMPIWLGIFAVSLWSYRWLSKLTPEDNRNGHMFVRSLSTLYSLFDIRVNEDIAKLSYEEFRASIEEILTEWGTRVDSARNFDKIELRKQFVEMHKVALIFGLCNETYARYFPKKDEVLLLKPH